MNPGKGQNPGGAPAFPSVRFDAKPGRPRGGPQFRILEMLEESPGLNIDEIAARLGVRRTAANHHLRILERSGILVRVRQTGHQLHFTSATSRFEREALCALRVPSVMEVVRHLFNGHAPSSSELAMTLDVTGRTTRRALRLLTTRGLLRVEQREGRKIAHLHPVLRILFARESRNSNAPPSVAQP